ncbi:hypothetical protein AC249_AIPGENE23501 [Exaiptasia diaphana]|nr:hypothetical protein AC249_AIPGENE23501 [Exaiptasia diaphana]
MVAATVGDDDCNTSSSKAPRSINTTSFTEYVTPVKEEVYYAGMSPVWHSIQSKGISEAAGRLIVSSWRKGTAKQYSKYITKWTKFCSQREIDQAHPNVGSVLKHLYQQGLTYSAINTARSALSSYITFADGMPIGKHPLGGKYDNASDEVREESKGVLKTNIVPERDFSMLDRLMAQKPNATTMVYEGIVMFSKNDTAGWRDSLQPEKRENREDGKVLSADDDNSENPEFVVEYAAEYEDEEATEDEIGPEMYTFHLFEDYLRNYLRFLD